VYAKSKVAQTQSKWMRSNQVDQATSTPKSSVSIQYLDVFDNVGVDSPLETRVLTSEVTIIMFRRCLATMLV